MKFFDPQRPSSDSIPIGQWDQAAHGLSGRFPLPVLYVEPGEAEGLWLVTAHMPTSGNSFAGYQAKLVGPEALAKLFSDWLEDPERTLKETFRYDPSVVRKKASAREVVKKRSVAEGLAALGLD